MGPTWRIDGGMTGAGTDPFDLSKALEGAAKAHLDPSISKFNLEAEYGPAGDQEKAIEKTLSQLRNSQFIHRVMACRIY